MDTLPRVASRLSGVPVPRGAEVVQAGPQPATSSAALDVEPDGRPNHEGRHAERAVGRGGSKARPGRTRRPPPERPKAASRRPGGRVHETSRRRRLRFGRPSRGGSSGRAPRRRRSGRGATRTSGHPASEQPPDASRPRVFDIPTAGPLLSIAMSAIALTIARTPKRNPPPPGRNRTSASAHGGPREHGP